MTTYYSNGSDIVAVETCTPGHGSMLMGVGATKDAATTNMSVTPIEGHLSPLSALRWGISEGWWTGAEYDSMKELEQ